jgi:hypothetical protein
MTSDQFAETFPSSVLSSLFTIEFIDASAISDCGLLVHGDDHNDLEDFRRRRTRVRHGDCLRSWRVCFTIILRGNPVEVAEIVNALKCELNAF